MKKSQRGFSLIETLICIAILGIVAVGFLSALSTTVKSVALADDRETAKNLAESQMEYIKDLSYASSYSQSSSLSSEYPGYSANITAYNITSRNGNIQRIVISILHNNVEVLSLEDFKVR